MPSERFLKAFHKYHGRDYDPDYDPPEPFLTWEEWQRTADSEERHYKDNNW